MPMIVIVCVVMRGGLLRCACSMSVRRVGTTFWLKRFVHGVHDQMHGLEQVGQHMVGLDFQVIRLEFNRYMAVAQMVGGTDQVKR